MTMTKFGKELREYRIENDMIMKDMAERLGIGVAALSSYEHGKKIEKEMLDKIEKEFGLKG